MPELFDLEIIKCWPGVFITWDFGDLDIVSDYVLEPQ
jgi:hypothetical protein